MRPIYLSTKRDPSVFIIIILWQHLRLKPFVVDGGRRIGESSGELESGAEAEGEAAEEG